MNSSSKCSKIVGRFAPSPSGRMHLGNVFTALMSWLSVRSRGGRWVLRIEDLDPQRSKIEHSRMIEDDLNWLGLDWDEGGLDERGQHGPYSQSQRGELYGEALDKLTESGLTYRCRCTRADIMATQAPHEADGRVVYAGTCRPSGYPPFVKDDVKENGAVRLFVPDREIRFVDGVFGPQSVNLIDHCGDFVVQRADGAWAYQLAVVVDDALMGVTEVMRGCDLMLSSAQQIYLYELLGYEVPKFCHLPLLCNKDGLRLSKRDKSVDMGSLRERYKAEEVIGRLASIARILDRYEPCTAKSLIDVFDRSRLPQQKTIEI